MHALGHAFLLLTVLAAPAAAMCPGDCNRDGDTTAAEVAIGVEIALGREPMPSCPGLEGSDLQVDVAELVAAVLASLGNCPPTPTPTEVAATPTAPAGAATATPTPSPSATATGGPALRFCDLPGSVLTTGPGKVIVPGGPAAAPDLTWMELPIGFCVHFFANLGNPRQLRFSPSGDLFVASPTGFTTGGGAGGLNAIAILPDDDGDGVADERITFLDGLPRTQGMLFHDGFFYYQDHTRILRRPYGAGDRAPSEPVEEVADITVHSSALHWPKALDVADDGTLYVANGSDQTERCDPTRPFRGGVLALDGTPGGRQVMKGFRNPIAVRCTRGNNLCFAIELARDYTAAQGGREKLVRIREGDLGFPCCATRDTPHHDIRPIPDCSEVIEENTAFLIGGTPFDLDFETGRWPAPWTHRAFIPLHGAYGLWEGARVVAVERDAMTGDALPGSDLTGVSSGSMADFALGWGDGKRRHGRPANVAFAADGRLFLGNDNDGNIVWIAPLELPIAP